MEWYHIYLFTRLDTFNNTCFPVLFIGGMVMLGHIAISLIWEGSYTHEDDVKVRTSFRRRNPFLVAAWLFMAVMYLAVPTQKEAAAIYLLPKLAKSDFAKEAQQIPTDAAKLMRLNLEKWIGELQPAVKGK